MPIKVDAETRDRIIDRARTVAAERDWSFVEPFQVTASFEAGEAVWLVDSNYMSLGRNVKVVLRQSDLSVVRAGFLPR